MSAKTVDRPRHHLRKGFDLRRSLPVALVRACHPRQALLTSVVLAAAAAMAGLTTGEVGLVFATILVGQVILGWHNDLVDAARDRSHDRSGKPIAEGHVEPGSVWFALICAVLLVVPLSIANGVTAGLVHLGILVIALAANAGLLRRTAFSYLTWMAAFGLFPAFLAYHGWDGGDAPAPSILITLLAALLGIGVHVLTSLAGLVNDNKDGIRHFPLRLALKAGAPRLLLISGAYTALVSVAILIAGATSGLVQ
jgi:4-hydroxybenzoate polyprenyltransferase